MPVQAPRLGVRYGVPISDFLVPHISFHGIYRRTPMFQAHLCPQRQTPSCQHPAHSYHRVHCSLPPRRLPCLLHLPFHTLVKAVLQGVCSVSGAWAVYVL